MTQLQVRPQYVPKYVPSGTHPRFSVVRPPVPLPPGTDHRIRCIGNHHQCVPNPGTDHENPTTEESPMQHLFNPGTTWLITNRTRPAWTAVLDLLDDNNWHPTADVYQAMRATSGLADRTIRKHLNSAGRRQWIETRRSRTRLRNPHLIEAALDQTDLKETSDVE